MYIAEYGAPVNRTSDGSERAVANSIFVVATCPADNAVTTIAPHSTLIKIPQYGVYETHFRSYNQYGVLIDHDLSGVVLSAPAELGVVEGNKFTCTGTEPGILTATYNGTVTTQITVIPTPTSNVEILLDSILIDKYKDYAIEVSALTANGVQPILAEVLAWKVENPTIAAVENGVLKALSNGKTYAVGALGELTDTIYVTVENPAASREVSDVFIPGEWTIGTITELKPDMAFNTDNVPAAWEHGAAVNFTYKTGRLPFVQLAKDYRLYGLPDTVKIVANIGSLQLKNAVISLRANNAGKELYQYTINAPFPANTDFDLSVPIASLFEDAGIAIYPLYFNKVNFNIETSNTIGANYTIALKEIALIYGGASGTGITVPKTSAFSVYPNPVTGNEIVIRLNDMQAQSVRVEIYTLSGLKVQAEQLGVHAGGTVSFTKKNLQPGLYLLKVYRNEKADVVKLIVK
jgi:post-segregation antitoxin (ccd killing protein)